MGCTSRLGTSPRVELLATGMFPFLCLQSAGAWHTPVVKTGIPDSWRLRYLITRGRLGSRGSLRFGAALFNAALRTGLIVGTDVVVYHGVRAMAIITLTTIRTIVSILTKRTLLSGNLRLFQMAISAFVTICTLTVIATDRDKPSRMPVPTAT